MDVNLFFTVRAKHTQPLFEFAIADGNALIRIDKAGMVASLGNLARKVVGRGDGSAQGARFKLDATVGTDDRKIASRLPGFAQVLDDGRIGGGSLVYKAGGDAPVGTLAGMAGSCPVKKDQHRFIVDPAVDLQQLDEALFVVDGLQTQAAHMGYEIMSIDQQTHSWIITLTLWADMGICHWGPVAPPAPQGGMWFIMRS
jgi:hypothetical protein